MGLRGGLPAFVPSSRLDVHDALLGYSKGADACCSPPTGLLLRCELH